MPKQWKLKPTVPDEILQRYPELNPLVVQLLFNLGLTEESDVERFMAPEYENQHDPFIFHDMQKACERIWEAVFNEEKICIYGDYDADAVTANAVLQQTFRYLGVSVVSYIPDRFTEGYGLNIEAFEKIKADGTTVVITVDCGTNSVDVAEFCEANGIDLIITDHHEITGETPQSFALINPKNPADIYPDNQITGVGVAYKLAQALLGHRENVVTIKQIEDEKYVAGWDKWLLDLVSIGTVADCHSLLGENRILVSLGLKVMMKSKWLGLRQLLVTADVDLRATPPDARMLGFVVAPRINAAGRLEHADIALELLLSEDPAKAQELAAALEQINKRRQDITMRAVSEAQEQVAQIVDRKVLLLTNQEWPKGVVGLIAGRLAEQYKKPVLILERGEVESTGSARTGNNFNIVEALKSASHLLVKFGGHKQAAGLTVRTEHIEVLYEALLNYAEQTQFENEEPVLEIDTVLKETDVTLATHEQVSVFEPFGIGNPKPVFMIEGTRVVSTRTVGKEQQHLQMTLAIGNVLIDSIAFSMGYLANKLDSNAIIDVAVELLSDEWGGTRKLKLRIIDVKIHD
ncbi:MAG: single-stranded-DNA-specific exonuclease RecJ [Candidatus Doudnabacteria bacterium]|nr:single-stranded-DNA-specific exonuclease RecJ [Candidatus Doudnabacteria bacterium]